MAAIHSVMLGCETRRRSHFSIKTLADGSGWLALKSFHSECWSPRSVAYTQSQQKIRDPGLAVILGRVSADAPLARSLALCLFVSPGLFAHFPAYSLLWVFIFSSFLSLCSHSRWNGPVPHLHPQPLWAHLSLPSSPVAAVIGNMAPGGEVRWSLLRRVSFPCLILILLSVPVLPVPMFCTPRPSPCFLHN